MKTWLLGGFIIFLALINLYMVIENKTLIQKDISLAQNEEDFLGRLKRCHDQRAALLEQKQRLQVDYDNMKNAYDNLRLGK